MSSASLMMEETGELRGVATSESTSQMSGFPHSRKAQCHYDVVSIFNRAKTSSSVRGKSRRRGRKKSRSSVSPSFSPQRALVPFPFTSLQQPQERALEPLSLSLFSPPQPPSHRAFLTGNKLELLQSPSEVRAFICAFDVCSLLPLPPFPLPLSSLLPVIAHSFLCLLQPPAPAFSISGYLPFLPTLSRVSTSPGSLVRAQGDAFSSTFHRYRALRLRPRPTPSSPVFLQPPRKHGSLPTTIISFLVDHQFNQVLSSEAATFRDVPIPDASSKVRRTPSTREHQRRSNRPFKRSA